MSACEVFRWLICTVGQLHRRIVGEGSKTLYINRVISSVQLMSHFSSRPHPAGFCRTILLMFSTTASAPGFVNPFHWSRTIENFRIKEFSVRQVGRGKKKKEKKILKFHYKLSISCALNLKQSISYTDPQFWCPSCSLSQLLRRVQSQHLTFPVTGFGGSCLWLAQPLTVCLLIFFLECMWDITHQYD